MVCIACVACSESSESIDTIAGKAVFRLETAVPDARTELTTAEDGRYKAIWKAGDSYAVVQVADESVALSTGTVDEDAPSISAIAMFDQVAASSYRYIFASPTVVASADGSSVELSMADSQAPATMDTFDGSTDLILSDVVERTSQPNGVSVPFNAQRISAIGKMTIKNLPLAEGETATSVTFATTKPIAGKLSIMVSDIAAGTPLQNSAVSEPSAAVTVTLPQAQSGDFTAYFSCLPTILSAGEEYSVTVNTTNSSYTKQGQVPSDMSFTSGRMTSFAVNMSGTGSMIPSDLNRVIFYTSTDGNVVTPYKTDAFGANIVSNTYENGQGVITFDGEVTTIGANAFWTRVTLASITLPQSVNSIGYYAFQGCNSLRSITIPDSVTDIDTNPFLDCKALEEFSGKFASEDKRSLVVGGSLVSFAIGSGVTEYSIPSDVNIVGSSSFAGCTTLTAVTIPSSTTVIRAAAFSNCSNLASVYCRPTTTPTGAERMFYGNATDRKIYVPSTAVDAYKSAQHWSDYADAIVAEEGKSSEPFMEGNSRLYVGDQIHIFNKINHSDTYTYNGEIDANGRPILELTTPTYYTNHTEIDKVIAVYCPEGTPILTIDENGSATTVKAIVRSKQKYHKDSYAIGSAPMVSVSDDISSIQLKNICGRVKLSITGNGEILKKIEFTGNKNEELATSSMISSSATISLSDLSVTSVGYAFTKLTMDFDNADEDENWDTATLSTTPTDFYFTMLPVALTDGFTVKIFCTDGTVMTKNFVVSTKVTRNSTITTEQFEYIGEQVKLNVSDLNTPVFRDLTYSEGYANTFEVKVANNSYQNGYFIFYNPDYVPSGAGDAGTLNGEYEIVSGNIGAKPGKKALIADPSRCWIPYDGDMYYFKSGKVTVSGTNESTTMVFDAIVTNSEGSDVPLQSQCTLASMGYTTSTSGTFTDIFGMASNVEFRYKQSGNQLAIQGGTESGNLMTLYLKATSFNNILGKEFTTSSTTDAILSGNLYFTGDTGSNYPYVDGGIKIEGNALSSKLYPNNLKFIDEEGSIYNIIAPDAGYYSIKLGNGTIYETGFNW